MRRAALEERLTILDERLKVFEAPPEPMLALADSKAQARCAREQAERARRHSLLVVYSIVAFWLVVDAVLVLWAWLSGP